MNWQTRSNPSTVQNKNKKKNSKLRVACGASTVMIAGSKEATNNSNTNKAGRTRVRRITSRKSRPMPRRPNQYSTAKIWPQSGRACQGWVPPSSTKKSQEKVASNRSSACKIKKTNWFPTKKINGSENWLRYRTYSAQTVSSEKIVMPVFCPMTERSEKNSPPISTPLSKMRKMPGRRFFLFRKNGKAGSKSSQRSKGVL